MKSYKAILMDSEIKFPEEVTRKDKRSTMIIRNAYILLNANEGTNGKKQKDGDYLAITTRTLENIRKKFVLEDLKQFSMVRQMIGFILKEL